LLLVVEVVEETKLDMLALEVAEEAVFNMMPLML
jgi:hypothetical protein